MMDFKENVTRHIKTKLYPEYKHQTTDTTKLPIESLPTNQTKSTDMVRVFAVLPVNSPGRECSVLEKQNSIRDRRIKIQPPRNSPRNRSQNTGLYYKLNLCSNLVVEDSTSLSQHKYRSSQF